MPKPMTLADVPSHARPEEFLTDAGLADLYERELASAPAGPKRAELQAKAARARLAALTTEAVQAQAVVDAEASLAKRQADAKDEHELFDKLLQGKSLTAQEQERAKAYRDAHKA